VTGSAFARDVRVQSEMGAHDRAFGGERGGGINTRYRQSNGGRSRWAVERETTLFGTKSKQENPLFTVGKEARNKWWSGESWAEGAMAWAFQKEGGVLRVTGNEWTELENNLLRPGG